MMIKKKYVFLNIDILTGMALRARVVIFLFEEKE